MSKIEPTIGRRIWYFPMMGETSLALIDKKQPCDAGIVFVHPNGLVNLIVTDHYGFTARVEDVEIVEIDDCPATNDGFAQWMPYQVKADAGRKEGNYSAGPVSDGGLDPRNYPSDKRVTPDQIKDLLSRVIYLAPPRLGHRTSTFVHAFLDGTFYMATGHSACVDPANFDEQLGLDIAQKNAAKAVEQKLWELEGYALYKSLQ